MKVTVNGTEKDVPVGLTVSGLLGELRLREDRVAVELGRAILHRDAYAETVLKDGDTVEIVGFVGGG